MSLKKQHHFLHLLLSSTPEQQKALLSTVTTGQTKALWEIAFNLPLLTDLGDHYNFVKYLGNRKHSLRYKKHLIKRYSSRLLKALLLWKDKLLTLLS